MFQRQTWPRTPFLGAERALRRVPGDRVAVFPPGFRQRASSAGSEGWLLRLPNRAPIRRGFSTKRCRIGTEKVHSLVPKHAVTV